MSHTCYGLEITSTLIFSTFMKEADARYRPCPNSTQRECAQSGGDSWKISDEVWETIVLIFGIMLFMVCGGAVILRWICDFMHKFKTHPNTPGNRHRRQQIACTSQSQMWYPGELPPPYDEAPPYEDVVLGDLVTLGLPPEPPPYCFDAPPGFEQADADEHDNRNQTINEEPPGVCQQRSGDEVVRDTGGTFGVLETGSDSVTSEGRRETSNIREDNGGNGLNHSFIRKGAELFPISLAHTGVDR